MSILTNITSGRIARPQKVVISAPEGFGKSTLASLFPNPLFFDVEDSTAQLDVNRLGRAALTDLKTLESGLAEVAKDKPCGSLVIDTIDWLENMALDDIIAAADNSKIQGVEDFGYGKGYTILKERLTLFLSKLDRVIAAGIHVVLLAHSKVVKFEPPDGAGPYDRYELKLSKHVAPLVKEWADMLLFGNWRVQIKEKDKNEAGAQYKGVGGRERLMHCNRSAAWDAKNRHGMADVEKWEIAVIEGAFKRVGAPWGEAAAHAKSEPNKPKPPTVKKEKAVSVVVEQPVAPGAAQPAPEVPKTASPEPDGIPMHHSTDQQRLDAAIDHAVSAPPPESDYGDLERVLGPHEEIANAYILDRKKITAGQTFRDAPAEYKERVLKNPAGFIDAIQAFAKLQLEAAK